MSAEVATLKKGTLIYRARSIHDRSGPTEPNRCDDTGKFGLYFSDEPKLCMAMAIEYNVPKMDLYKYEVNEPIILTEGKVSFRNIHPERYFDEDGQFIPNVSVLESENISHFDTECLPIYDGVDDHYGHFQSPFNEIFLNNRDLPKIKFVSSTTFTLEYIKGVLQEVFPDFPSDSDSDEET